MAERRHRRLQRARARGISFGMELTPSLIAACFWVIAATVTALLPMRLQFPPGITLLVLAPVLLAWMAFEQNPWVVLAAMAAFLSMFRNPLIYFARKAMGLPVSRPDLPPEHNEDAT